MVTDRIIEFIQFKGITKYKFCKIMGFSNGYLDKSRDINSKNYKKILEYFPEIDPTWLLEGKGNMLKS